MHISGKQCKRDRQHGASLVEYAFLLALFAAVCFAAVTLLTQPDEKAKASAKHASTPRVLADAEVVRVRYHGAWLECIKFPSDTAATTTYTCDYERFYREHPDIK